MSDSNHPVSRIVLEQRVGIRRLFAAVAAPADESEYREIVAAQAKLHVTQMAASPVSAAAAANVTTTSANKRPPLAACIDICSSQNFITNDVELSRIFNNGRSSGKSEHRYLVGLGRLQEFDRKVLCGQVMSVCGIE